MISKINEESRIKIRKVSMITGFVILLFGTLASLGVEYSVYLYPQDELIEILEKCGVYILGLAIDTVLYYMCMKIAYNNIEETTTRSFLLMVLFVGFSFETTAVFWWCYGKNGYSLVVLLNAAVNIILEMAITYCFWSYIIRRLEINNSKVGFVDKILRILLIPSIGAVLINIFVPVFFYVKDGEYDITRNFFYLYIYIAIVVVTSVVFIVTSEESVRQKIVALLFIIIPAFHYFFTSGIAGLPSEQEATLVALMIMFAGLYNEQFKSLALKKSELNTAAKLQQAMIPSNFTYYSDRTEFDLYATMTPAREVGGDFYDYFMVDDDHLCLVIADVSGKGVPAAMFMASAKSTISGRVRSGRSASSIIERVNDALCRDNPEAMFVTVWLGILDLSTGKMSCVNAGHERPVLKTSTEVTLLKDKHCPGVGVMPDIKYLEYELELCKGDMIFVYTDGVPEADKGDEKFFGTKRMIAALNSENVNSPKKALEAVSNAVDEFVEGNEQFDDITMLCLKYNG